MDGDFCHLPKFQERQIPEWLPPRLRLQGLVRLLWALGSLGAHPDTSWLHASTKQLAVQLSRDSSKSADTTASANTLVTALWAFGHLGTGKPKSDNQFQAPTVSSQGPTAAAPPAQAQAWLLGMLQAQLPLLPIQQLAKCCVALGRLGWALPPGFVPALEAALMAKLQPADGQLVHPQQLSHITQGLAHLQPPVSSTVLQALGCASSATLAHCLSCSAVPPGDSASSSSGGSPFEEATDRSSHTWQPADPEDPDSWLCSVEDRAWHSSSEAVTRACDLLTSLALLHARTLALGSSSGGSSGAEGDEAGRQQGVRQQAGLVLSPQQVASSCSALALRAGALKATQVVGLVRALAQAGMRPRAAAMRRLLERVQEELEAHGASTMTSEASSSDGSFNTSSYSSAIDRRQALHASQVARLMVALARMGYVPGGLAMARLMQCVCQGAKDGTWGLPDLASALWACAKIKQQLPRCV